MTTTDDDDTTADYDLSRGEQKYLELHILTVKNKKEEDVNKLLQHMLWNCSQLAIICAV
jgi:hypothetical protein